MNEDFTYRNNWKEHELGMLPPCKACLIDDCPSFSGKYDKPPHELVVKYYPCAVPAMVKWGFGSRIGYQCLRANLWLFGLDYEGVKE